MDMEIQLLHESFTEKDPKLFMGHIQRMGSGESLFFATTLSLVYDKLVEKAFPQPIPSGSGAGKPAEVRSVADPCTPIQASTPIPIVPSTSTNAPSPSPQAPAPALDPEPVPSSPLPPLVWLRCNQCSAPARLEDLYEGMRCPECPSRGSTKGRPFMQCPLCRIVRATPRADCVRTACRARFR